MTDEKAPTKPRSTQSAGHAKVEVGPLDSLEDGRSSLAKVRDGDAVVRLVCVRDGAVVHAMSDRCPHQGYPLSQGNVREGVLTCAWHNWKFDVRTGACTTGGDGVRRYPTSLEDGIVYVDTRVDVEAETARIERGLREALLEADISRGVREALRLDELQSEGQIAPMSAALSIVIDDSARRTQWGFDHAMAMTADLATWIERGWVDSAAALVRVVEAVGLANMNRPPRSQSLPSNLMPPEASEGADVIVGALVEERRAEAERQCRALTRSESPAHVIDQTLRAFVATHLLDYGHGAIFLHKARELCERFPGRAEEIVASVCVNLSWATRETALPPFARTREALASVPSAPPSGQAPEFAAAEYESAVLASEGEAVKATRQRLHEGVDPIRLLRAAGHAAAERLARFDDAWERGEDVEVSVLDVTHAVTFVEASVALASGAPFGVAAALSVQAAGFIGKLARSDQPGGTRPQRQSTPDLATPARLRTSTDALASLVEAAGNRDEPACLAKLGSMDRTTRIAAYPALAPFAAFDARIRPIQYAHTVKVLEALYRLETADPTADDTYLRALVRFIVPRRPEIQPRRLAAIARKFLADGRPPKGLY